jgi:3-methyladenine DNA glycosylase AlkC
MAEPLKNRFGPEVPKRIAQTIAQVHPKFDTRGFTTAALDGYEALELMPRARHIASALRRFLPEDYARAGEILIDSLGSKLERSADNGMAPFFYLPHVLFVAAHGLDHFELSMRAQYELTQRFTAEFSIRPFLIHHQARTLKQLAAWCDDASVHVRRLVSEGSRPRLPWAIRLPAFQHNPRPVLALLERLKDDPELYVRRSVANNLNDIGKDNPAMLIATAGRWLKKAPAPRAALVRHALRSSIKQGDQQALALLGFTGKADVKVRGIVIEPARVALGGKAKIAFDVFNTSKKKQRVLVDLKVHYAKAGGKTSGKVFKLKTIELAPRAGTSFAKTLSLADLTTRKHHAGMHKVEAMLNGHAVALGRFELIKAKKRGP